MHYLREDFLQPGRRAPLIVQPARHCENPQALVQMNAGLLADKLIEHGALLFRGFGIDSAAKFSSFSGVLSAKSMDYVFRSTPRTLIASGIFSATEYPPDQEIPLHCENSYQQEWPLRIALCCLTPAAAGGETPIADMREVTAQLGQAVLDKFESRRIRYVRHYRPNFDLPWQAVFQTQSRDEVARYCAVHGIAYEWLEEDVLRTAHVCQGVATHPQTKERVFFNQAHLFHISSMGPENAAALTNLFGADALPRNAFYGDGEQIPAEDLNAVRSALRSHSVCFRWQAGDVLLLDNMQMAHGRRPFVGLRRVIVSLLDRHSPAQTGSPALMRPAST